MFYRTEEFRKLRSEVRRSEEALARAVLALENTSRMKRENVEKLEKYAEDPNMIRALLDEQLVGNCSVRYLVTQNAGPEFAVVQGTTVWVLTFDTDKGHFEAACGDNVSQRSRDADDPDDKYARNGKHFIDTMRLLIHGGMKRLVACCPEGYLGALQQAMKYNHEEIPDEMYKVECCQSRMLPRAEQIPPNHDSRMFETCRQVVDDGRARIFLVP